MSVIMIICIHSNYYYCFGIVSFFGLFFLDWENNYSIILYEYFLRLFVHNQCNICVHFVHNLSLCMYFIWIRLCTDYTQTGYNLCKLCHIERYEHIIHIKICIPCIWFPIGPCACYFNKIKPKTMHARATKDILLSE